MNNFQINDIVKYKKSFFKRDEYIIVTDKENPWTKANPFVPTGTELIYVEKGKDFIILKRNGENFGPSGKDDNGIHVKKDEIEFIRKYSE